MLYDNYEVKLLQEQLSQKLDSLEISNWDLDDDFEVVKHEIIQLISPVIENREMGFEDFEKLLQIKEMVLNLITKVLELNSLLQHKLMLEIFSLYEIMKQEAFAGDAEARILLKKLQPKIEEIRLMSFSQN